MTRTLQLSLLLLLSVASITVPVYHWIGQSTDKNEADEVADLIGQISTYITPESKFSFTSNEEKIQGIVLYDYALLAAAPAVIPDNNFQHDTIIAINSHQNSKPNMYSGYQIIAKAYSNQFALQLLVKK